ncbi:Fur family transcriptional regulator [Nioella sp.]|jgi:Fur family zinc uptake transcriptional regulator|uniref:Fur family transcriptional regulator n=1 Tax=Nioella sp. TaxID=1912091 RepID=UPI00351765E2
MTDTIGFDRHDHSACRSGGLEAVEAYCADQGLKFTPVRRRVLEILLEEHRALGAYEILDRLREDGHGSQPPVAYRALDFLTAHGFAHKIERLNAFTACSHPGENHAPVILICRICNAVAEGVADPGQGNLGRVAAQSGFLIERTVTEAEGICPNCQAKGAA